MTETNPFAPAPATRDVATADAGAAALVAREVQAVQGAIIAAKRFPRDQRAAFDRIIQTCQRVTLAEQAMYSYSRGGSEVTGPSIRLAEALAQNWGNLDFGWTEIAREPGASSVLAYCWDLETNVRRALQFKVPHVRDTKKGSYTLTNERDIYELLANQSSRRVRNCVLSVLPGDVIEAAVGECEKTLASKGAIEEKRRKIVAAFREVEVTREDLERRLGKKIEAISDVDYVQLRKVWKSLKDGMSEKADWFEPVLEPEKIKRAQAEGAAADVPRPPAAAPQRQAEVEADRKAAIAEFEAAVAGVRRRGGDPEKILGRSTNDVLLGRVEDMLAAGDHLTAWSPA